MRNTNWIDMGGLHHNPESTAKEAYTNLAQEEGTRKKKKRLQEPTATII